MTEAEFTKTMEKKGLIITYVAGRDFFVEENRYNKIEQERETEWGM